MSKKQDLNRAKQDVFDAKIFFVKNAKRYLIIMLITLPVAMVLNVALSKVIPGYTGVVVTIFSLIYLIIGCLIGFSIFAKLDKKRQENSNKAKERDPFAD